jgi:hypothetical protein
MPRCYSHIIKIKLAGGKVMGNETAMANRDAAAELLSKVP